jgi:hypothetical protein
MAPFVVFSTSYTKFLLKNNFQGQLAKNNTAMKDKFSSSFVTFGHG